MINLTGQPKWGGTQKKMIFKPKWARWKMYMQFYKASAEYFSYDYHNVYVNAVKTKCYCEEMALLDMIARMREEHPTGYRYANVFGNFSDDLSTEKKNYNHLIFSMTPDKCTWKQNVIYSRNPIDGTGYKQVRVDVSGTLKGWIQREETKIAEARQEIFKPLTIEIPNNEKI